MEFLVPSPVCSSIIIIISTLMALILSMNLEYPFLLLRVEVSSIEFEVEILPIIIFKNSLFF